MSDLKIAVVGAGVVGLTTALQLQEEIRGAQITVIADKFEQNTTSYVAAGLFRPSSYFAGPTPQITSQWVRDSYEYWDNIRITREASNAGITQISGYVFSNISPNQTRNHHIEKIVPIYRRVTEDELDLVAGKYKYGSFSTTILIECGLFLPWAKAKYLNAGGTVSEENVDSLVNVGKQYDVVLNCTGFGAKSLCNDMKLVPIRGQILRVHAPWLKMFMYGDLDTYIIPGFKSVKLGGTKQFDSYNLQPCKYDTAKIKENCEALAPSLKKAPIIDELVGLRPHRDPVRVAKETIKFNGGKVKIVHNYGHGGYGVTTSPGTAKFAVQLVKETLMGNSKL